jgi:DNA-nicking Smr family endonuclease
MNRRRKPSHDDLTLWQRAMRDVRPLRARPKTKTPKPPPGPQPAPLSSAPAPVKPRRAAPAPLALPKIGGHRAPGLDKSSAEKLKRGRYTIERRLDLHGMTQEAAHRALAGFIARAAEDDVRCVLVITGKGFRRLSDNDADAAQEIGILRQAVPRWLNEAPNRARILAFGTAQPRDGGVGALYVLLRRRR